MMMEVQYVQYDAHLDNQRPLKILQLQKANTFLRKQVISSFFLGLEYSNTTFEVRT